MVKASAFARLRSYGLALGLSVLSLGAFGYTLKGTFASEVDYVIDETQLGSASLIFYLPRNFWAHWWSSALGLAPQYSDHTTIVFGTVTSGQNRGAQIIVNEVPMQGLSIGNLGQARMTSHVWAHHGPLTFPRDFWTPITLAFLGLGFGAYARIQRRHFLLGDTP